MSPTLYGQSELQPDNDILKRAFGGIINGDLCKTSPFAQFLRQTQILILEILHVFLRLKSSSSLNLNKRGRFSKVSNLIEEGL